MREIKFRAWDGKRMTTSGIMFNNTTSCLEVPFGSQMKLMQYTGLKDKNGKEIYEGDVVNLEINGYNMKCVYVPFLIVFNIDGFQGCNLIKNKKDFLNGSFLKQPRRFNYKEWKKFQVIGNIYENPELLNN